MYVNIGMSESEPKDTKPDTKIDPKVDPKDTPDDKPEVKTITQDEIVVSKTGFVEMQKQLLTLQKEAEDSKKAATKAERDSVYNELLILNPKLAKIHVESNKEILTGALSAAKEIKGGFSSLDKTDKKDPKKASYSDHDSISYDFEASQKEGKKVWAFS